MLPPKITQTLRKAADYIDRFGFSPYFSSDGGPRCFIGAISSASMNGTLDGVDIGQDAITFFEDVIFAGQRAYWYNSGNLIREGWNKDDAVAALAIAADLAEAEGV